MEDASAHDSNREDCSWAHLDENLGWGCETLFSLHGGMTSNTKVVLLTPPDGSRSFKAVLKEQNSNDNVQGLEFLENEREIVAYLQENGYPHMAGYILGLKVQPKYQKYKHSMTLSTKNNCDNKKLYSGACEINPAWAECNKRKGTGNLDTKKLLTVKEKMHGKALDCPDSQLLAIEFLEGYADLPHLQAQLQQETAFVREVRAAALFAAYDTLRDLQVSHCDFNSGNVMFNVKDPSDAKIIDFGLSSKFEAPVGRCSGRIADLGPVSGGPAPGHLWFAIYRGASNEDDLQKFTKPGPLSLSTHGSFQNPKSGETMLSFTRMAGGEWAMAPATHWPQIVGYAQKLLAIYRSTKPAKKQPAKPANDDMHQMRPQQKIVRDVDPWKQDTGPPQKTPMRNPQRVAINEPPMKQNVHKVQYQDAMNEPSMKQNAHNMQHQEQRLGGESSVPACKSARIETGRTMFWPCKLDLSDKNKCLIKLECNGRRGKTYVSKEISQADSMMGRITVDNCDNCKQV